MKPLATVRSLFSPGAESLEERLARLRKRQSETEADRETQRERVNELRKGRQATLAAGGDVAEIEAELDDAERLIERLRARAEDLVVVIAEAEKEISERDLDQAAAAIDARLKKVGGVGEDAARKALGALVIFCAEASRLRAARLEEIRCEQAQLQKGLPTGPRRVRTLREIVTERLTDEEIRKAFPWFGRPGSAVDFRLQTFNNGTDPQFEIGSLPMAPDAAPDFRREL